ncbi:unnamed protein product [Pieris macdunnoughi]|uniref:Uncharacterized protein n=1 Tax=Pieris macdunnoughi TaxID=345717 RepID=A0A821XAQ8_9NEOP|nr:unnamed protein product [Pieris macdunnoughi]
MSFLSASLDHTLTIRFVAVGLKRSALHRSTLRVYVFAEYDVQGRHHDRRNSTVHNQVRQMPVRIDSDTGRCMFSTSCQKTRDMYKWRADGGRRATSRGCTARGGTFPFLVNRHLALMRVATYMRILAMPSPILGRVSSVEPRSHSEIKKNVLAQRVTMARSSIILIHPPRPRATSARTPHSCEIHHPQISPNVH